MVVVDGGTLWILVQQEAQQGREVAGVGIAWPALLPVVVSRQIVVLIFHTYVARRANQLRHCCMSIPAGYMKGGVTKTNLCDT